TGFDYTLTVTNNGPSDNVGGFSVADTLPAGTVFDGPASDNRCALAAGVVTCTRAGGLANGGTDTFTVHVNVPASVADGTVLKNTADVSSNGTTDPVSADDHSNEIDTTVHARADLAVTKSGPTDVNAGTGFDYTLTVTNN